MDKDEYYLDIAKTVSEKSTCLRRHFGAVIVKDDEIISTGYNGAPRHRENCSGLKFCIRDKLNIPHGERYEICRSVHAEQNAIISASRKDMIGATLFLIGIDPKTNDIVEGLPCNMCERFIINAGLKNIIVKCKYETVLKFEGDSDEEIERWKMHNPDKLNKLTNYSIKVTKYIDDDNSLEGISNYK